MLKSLSLSISAVALALSLSACIPDAGPEKPSNKPVETSGKGKQAKECIEESSPYAGKAGSKCDRGKKTKEGKRAPIADTRYPPTKKK